MQGDIFIHLSQAFALVNGIAAAIAPAAAITVLASLPTAPRDGDVLSEETERDSEASWLCDMHMQ